MYIRIALISIGLSGIYMPNMLNAQYRFSDQEFPVYTKKVDGIIMKYSGGLVAFTLKSKADEGDLQFLTTKLKGKILRSWSPSGTDELDVTMQIPFNSDPFTVVEELKNYSFVKIAEPNYVSTLETNDTYYSQQWSLSQQSDADIDAPEAWSITTGSSSVKIAVLDTGIPISGSSLAHEDLNDANHVVLISGSDVYETDNYPEDEHGHGTAVSGVAGAETNNSLGIAGVGYQCKLMPIRVALDATTPQLFKAGIYAAVDNGARVINFSHSFENGSAYLTEGIQYARNNECLLIVSAGNQNASISYPGYYSTSYDNLMAIAATDGYDDIADFSNQGSWINVAAPGVAIITTDIPGADGYETGDYAEDGLDGTSFSAPIVAGLAGLILSVNDTLSASIIRSIIQYTSDDLGDFGFDVDFGWGRINTERAVKCASKTFTTSGTLSGNEYWWGSITITGNVTVPTGVTLRIASGTVVTFSGSSYVTVQSGGSIVAESGVTFSPSDRAVRYSGTMSVDNTWGFPVLVEDNLTVSSGKWLTILEGTNVKINSGKKITINGKLIADGTSSYPITFNSASGTWYGIELNYCDPITLSHCTFQNASYAVKSYGTWLDMDYCTFSSNGWAINYDDESYGTIQYTSVSSSSTYGIYCTQNSTPTIRPYNRIWNNSGTAICGDDDSLPDLGTYYNGGNNSIKNNYPDDIWSDNSNTLYAEYNYWGSSSPSPYVSDNVDWDPYLTSEPTTGLYKSHYLAQPAGTAHVKEPADTTGKYIFSKAYDKFLQGNYSEAIQDFKVLLFEYADHPIAQQALSFINKCNLKSGSSDAAMAYLNQAKLNGKSDKIKESAKSISIGHFIRKGDYEAAKQDALDIIKSSKDRQLIKYALYDLGTIFWYFNGDEENGSKYFNQLIAEFPDDQLSESARSTLVTFTEPIKPALAKQSTVPASFDLQQNFPNPFNPSTQISYSLPEESEVTIKIFNMLGQHVATLIDQKKAAGYYTTKWNGVDANGDHAGAGLYLCRISAGNFAKTIKMLLVM